MKLVTFKCACGYETKISDCTKRYKCPICHIHFNIIGVNEWGVAMRRKDRSLNK